MAKVDMLNYFVGEAEDKTKMFGHLKEFLHKVSPYSLAEQEEKALSFMNDAFNTVKVTYVDMEFMNESIKTDVIVIGIHESEEGEIDFYDGE